MSTQLGHGFYPHIQNDDETLTVWLNPGTVLIVVSGEMRDGHRLAMALRVAFPNLNIILRVIPAYAAGNDTAQYRRDEEPATVAAHWFNDITHELSLVPAGTYSGVVGINEHCPNTHEPTAEDIASWRHRFAIERALGTMLKDKGITYLWGSINAGGLPLEAILDADGELGCVDLFRDYVTCAHLYLPPDVKNATEENGWFVLRPLRWQSVLNTVGVRIKGIYAGEIGTFAPWDSLGLNATEAAQLCQQINALLAFELGKAGIPYHGAAVYGLRLMGVEARWNLDGALDALRGFGELPAPIMPDVTPKPEPPALPPILLRDGRDVRPMLQLAADTISGVNRSLMLGCIDAESDLDARAERFGTRTTEAKAAIAAGDKAKLQAIIDDAGNDVSFGLAQRAVPWHWAGNRSLTVDNVLAVRAAVFADTQRDLIEMAKWLKSDLIAAKNGDLSPVGGDVELGALIVYNNGSYPPSTDAYWTRNASRVARYRTKLEAARVTYGLTPKPPEETTVDYPGAKWFASPNHSDRRGLAPIAIVWHIAVGTMAGMRSWFANPASKASSHYGVSKTGVIDQYVRENRAAWTNGINFQTKTYNDYKSDLSIPWIKRCWDEKIDPNRLTITIECEGKPGDVMPAAQEKALIVLTHDIASRHAGISLNAHQLIGHYKLDSVNRAFCPSFPQALWDKVIAPTPPPEPDYSYLGEGVRNWLKANPDAGKPRSGMNYHDAWGNEVVWLSASTKYPKGIQITARKWLNWKIAIASWED